jgi:hypothetical protein
MGLEDVILVGSVREKVRTYALTESRAGIMERIKAWGSVEPCERPVGLPTPVFDVPPPSLVHVEVPVAGQWVESLGSESEDEWLELSSRRPPGAHLVAFGP